MPNKTKLKSKPKEDETDFYALVGGLVKEIQLDREENKKRFDVMEKSLEEIRHPNVPVVSAAPMPVHTSVTPPEQPKVGGTPAPAKMPQRELTVPEGTSPVIPDGSPPAEPQTLDAPIPIDFLTAKNEILGEDFGIKVEPHTDNPVFTLIIVVPKEYSNYPYYDQVGADIRSKVISYAQGIHEVKKYFELIKTNLGPENLLKGKMAKQNA